MDPKEYIKNVLVTESRDFAPLKERFSQTRNIRLLHGAIGLASELSEIQQATFAEELDPTNIKEEIGDVYWYMGVIVNELELDAEELLGHKNGVRKGFYNENDDIRKYFEQSAQAMTISVGNLIDVLKKTLMYGKELNTKGIEQEIRTLAFETEYILNLFGATPDQARERNIEKLRARYGEKFTEAAALERNLTVERAILESK